MKRTPFAGRGAWEPAGSVVPKRSARPSRPIGTKWSAILAAVALCGPVAGAFGQEYVELPAAGTAAPDPIRAQLQDLLRRLEDTERELARLKEDRQRISAQPVGLLQPPPYLPSEAPGNYPTSPPGYGPPAPAIDPYAGPAGTNVIPGVDPLPEPDFDRQEFDEGPLDLGGVPLNPGRFSVRPKGRISIQSLTYDQTQANKRTLAEIPGNRDQSSAPNFLGFDALRIGLEGEGYRDVFYEVELDLADAGRPGVTDAFIAVTNLPYFGTVFVGHSRVDISLERVPSEEHLAFINRSIMQALIPGRRTGIKFRNVSDDGRATWASGIFRQGEDDYGNTMSDSGDYLVAARTTYLPWYDEASGGRGWWHVGCGALFYQPADGLDRFRTNLEQDGVLADDAALRLPFFASTDEFAADFTQVFNLETALNLGSLNIQAEYTTARINRPSAAGVRFWGAYLEASWFLTGENRTYRKNRGTYGRVRPYEEFFAVQEWPSNRLAFGRGAWQAAARVSHLDLDDGGIQGGTLTDVTLGLNWLLNRRTRVQFNYIRPFLKYQGTDSEANLFASRFQIFF